ncbi:acetylcholinesterase precursor [Delitschia confertaspora ATCC 74209]|uniref:Carboxylic ester hydrolase n=1 Tax=Delitschia confertaspora ATCC 74209 TaxID=1513339 RepID=A0A9P4JLX1_9PLEO|nr:acetylcholinesterase precursor [Delitschia confertaspora ATCC 74209]
MSPSSMFKLVAVAAVLCSAQAQQNYGSSLPIVDLGYELHQASSFNATGGFYNFSNIRYAEPPVGPLRFAPPKAPKKNRTQVQTGSVGRICPQAGPAWSQAATQFLTASVLGFPYNTSQPLALPNSTAQFPKQDPRTSEDCLFLDVFAPKSIFENANKTKNHGAPVLVWIYGGGYTGGSKNINPSGLLAASGNVSNGEVIIVAMNYRLGALGWISGPSYQAEGGVSNLALLDQRLALEWVQKNIHLFGGDKKRVTVFGESAGGGSIMHQITAYGGLKGKVPFQQAIPQSPGWVPISGQVQQENTYQRFLNLTNTTSLAELRKLPSDVIMRANWFQITHDSAYGTFTYGPVVDGNFVPQQPGQLLAQGRFDKSVKVMVGHNANEGAYFTPPGINSTEDMEEQLRTAFYNIPDSSITTITEKLYPAVYNGSYPYKTPFDRASFTTAEAVFTCNTYYLSTALKNQTYSYEFAVPPAYHGFDVPYTFYDGGAVSAVNPTEVMNATVAVALQEFITSFAVKGVPSAPGIRKFDMYGPDARVMELNVTSIEEVMDSNANVRCNWWQKALYT